MIDGIRLSAAQCIRYRHNDLTQLERLLEEHHTTHHRVIIVTESIFSMDGDQADLQKLTELKRKYDNVLLYVDEAHAFGVRGRQGLGCAEEFHCIQDIDFLVGTFGKAAASVGAYIVCKKVIREYLVNRMRTLIFTTGLPPVNIAWTLFIVRRLADMQERRKHFGAYQPDASRSFTGTRVYMPQRQPYRPNDNRSERRHSPAGGSTATAWLLRPASPSADSTGGHVAHPLFADSGNQKRRNRRAE
mgnify:CR=1 FL=1